MTYDETVERFCRAVKDRLARGQREQAYVQGMEITDAPRPHLPAPRRQLAPSRMSGTSSRRSRHRCQAAKRPCPSASRPHDPRPVVCRPIARHDLSCSDKYGGLLIVCDGSGGHHRAMVAGKLWIQAMLAACGIRLGKVHADARHSTRPMLQCRPYLQPAGGEARHTPGRVRGPAHG